MPSRNPSLRLKLRPDLIKPFGDRASSLGLTTSGLLAALVWNDHVQPDQSLQAIESPPRLARAPLSCSLRRTHRNLAMRLAHDQRLSLNAYLEALISAELISPAQDFVIRAGSPKQKIQQ